MLRFSTSYDEKTKIWTGPARTILFDTNVFLGQAILDALGRQPNKIGQISDNNGKHLTNIELRQKTLQAAHNLIEMGFKKDDVIGIIAKNSSNLAPIVFASLLIGAPVHSIDPLYDKDVIAPIIALTSPKIVFCDEDNLKTVREALYARNMNIPIFLIEGQTSDTRAVDELFVDKMGLDNFIPPELGDSTKATAIILSSSGTTGLPKAVCLSHASLLVNQYESTTLSAHSIMTCFSTIDWISGLETLIAATLHGSTRIITTEIFRSELMLHFIEKYKVTHLYLQVPELGAIVEHAKLPTTDLFSLSHITCGGTVVPHDFCEKFNRCLHNNFKIYVVYGSSESAGLITANYPIPKQGSVGQLNAGYSVKIVDDNGDQCGIGVMGEIYVQLIYPFLGYYGNAEETRSVIDNDGWLHMGDIGYFDDEGYLYIIDRKKDMLLYNKYEISPSEIEIVILSHPGVQNVCVVGISDIMFTELPAAVVVRNNCEIYVLEEDIKNIVKEKLSDYKQLRGGVYFVDSLPMTSSGKIIRRKVKATAIELYKQRAMEQ